MPNTSPSSGSSGQTSNRNRNRNKNRNRNRGSEKSRTEGSNRNRRSNDSDNRGTGHRTGGYTREKVPRRAPQPSLWKRILAFFGLGGDPTAKPKTKAASTKARSNKPSSSKPDHSPNKPSPRNNRERSERKKRPARTPVHVEVSCPRLYVGNLSYDTTEEDLTELFNGVGGVESAEIVTHRDTQRSKGFAFVTLRSTDEAKRAVDVLHDQDFMGRKISVSGAKSKGPGDTSSSAA